VIRDLQGSEPTYYDLIHYVAVKPGIEQVVQTFGTSYQTSRFLNQWNKIWAPYISFNTKANTSNNCTYACHRVYFTAFDKHLLIETHQI